MTIEAEVDRTAPSAVLDRVGLVLDTFDGAGRLTLAQIVRRTGLPRSSAHRILDRLVSMRWLHREGRTYTLGLRLMELGSLAVHQDRLHATALPHLQELHRVTGFVVHLAVLDGDDLVYLEKIGGRLATAVPTRVGGRRPARSTALGKALLAYEGTPGAAYDHIREQGGRLRKRGVAGRIRVYRCSCRSRRFRGRSGITVRPPPPSAFRTSADRARPHDGHRHLAQTRPQPHRSDPADPPDATHSTRRPRASVRLTDSPADRPGCGSTHVGPVDPPVRESFCG